MPMPAPWERPVGAQGRESRASCTSRSELELAAALFSTSNFIAEQVDPIPNSVTRSSILRGRNVRVVFVVVGNHWRRDRRWLSGLPASLELLRVNAKLTAEDICQLAFNKNELAMRAVEREAYYLGLGLANLINLFVPDVIVMGGSVMKSALLFLEGIRKSICRGCRFVPYEKTDLVLASLGDDANLIGAARVWHHRFGNEPEHVVRH